jgi:hypothetical protein
MSRPLPNISIDFDRLKVITYNFKSMNLPALDIRYSSYQYNLERLNREIKKYTHLQEKK